MKTLTRVAVAAALVAAAQAGAKPIASPEEIESKSVIRVDFSEVKAKNNAAFGSYDVGQPYARIGLVLPSQTIDASANLSKENTVGIRSTGISDADNSSYQSLGFTNPQKFVGFNVKSEKATALIVSALDKDGNELERQVLPASKNARFVGFARPASDITVVRVVAPHATRGDAMQSPTLVSDVSFAVDEKDKPESEDVTVSDVATAGAVGEGILLAAGGGEAVASLNGSAAYRAAVNALEEGQPGSDLARNPGNRNPNLPPSIIPEPAAMGLIPVALLALRRRRA